MNETKVWAVSERNTFWNRLKMEDWEWRMTNAGNMRIEMSEFWKLRKKEKVCLESIRMTWICKHPDWWWKFREPEWNLSTENGWCIQFPGIFIFHLMEVLGRYSWWEGLPKALTTIHSQCDDRWIQNLWCESHQSICRFLETLPVSQNIRCLFTLNNIAQHWNQFESSQ
jgi:hypothetical protein